MPYPELHHKVTVYGDAYNGSEQWSFGWRMRAVSGDNAAAQARADAIGPAVSAYWTHAASPKFMGTHRLQGVKVAAIQPDGTYPDGHVAGEVFFANIPGPENPAPPAFIAPQSSLCITLMTAVPRGLASRGRFFLPPMNVAIGTDGLVEEVYRDAAVTAVQSFLTAVNNAEAGNADIAIFSRGVGVKTFNPVTEKIEWTYPNPGAVNNVTRVEVGKVLDTQRRRRRSLVEAREGANLG